MAVCTPSAVQTSTIVVETFVDIIRASESGEPSHQITVTCEGPIGTIGADTVVAREVVAAVGARARGSALSSSGTVANVGVGDWSTSAGITWVVWDTEIDECIAVHALVSGANTVTRVSVDVSVTVAAIQARVAFTRVHSNITGFSREPSVGAVTEKSRVCVGAEACVAWVAEASVGNITGFSTKPSVSTVT